MAQHDYVIANGTGAAVRSDLNNGLAAIVSQNSGATEPATMYAYQWWADTTTGLLKIRNSANNAWVTVGTLASANLGLAALASPTFTGTVTAPTFTARTAVNIPLGSAGSPTLFFTGDSNTGLISPGADAIALATAGTNRLHITSGGLVGIGTTTVDYKLDVNGSAQIRAGESLYFQNAAANGRASIQCAGAGTNTDLTINTAGSERCRVDGSGRLLVGTSTAQGGAKLQVQDGEVFLRRSLSNASINAAGVDLGFVDFGNQDGGVGAQILAESDAAWGAGDYPGRLVFSVTRDGQSSPTEAFRISNTGNLASFTASPTDAFDLRSGATAGTANYLYRGVYGATGVSVGGTISFQVFTNGNVQNTNNSYTAISDVKLKENIVDANSQWNDLKALRVRNYNLKEGQTHTQIGLVAQEVEPISPGLVYESPDRDADGNDLGTVTKSVNYSVLYMKAVKALQEAMERIEQLEAKVAALETP